MQHLIGYRSCDYCKARKFTSPSIDGLPHRGLVTSLEFTDYANRHHPAAGL